MGAGPNKLIHEKSPYLIQHADNPVNWYPWEEEAFEKAKNEDKPIFLSIGYSTCHWCHVMARESFEDSEVAQFLNEHYVSIKVDREERPDIDSVYMKVCQMMRGQGGWPLNVVMTPDKVPFFAGMYFPRENKYGMPSIMDVLTQLHERYQQDPSQINKVAENVREALQNIAETKSENRLTKAYGDDAFKQLADRFDDENGGFGHSPKFPQPQNVMFLLQYYYFTGEQYALEMAEQTLQSMAAGGIFDHVGFGFARYATDEQWIVPHFEKMLYDNALLLMAYTECYQLTETPFYKQMSERIITFIQREMTDPEHGAFYSAIDAESEGVEGKYYVWDEAEITDIVGEELGDIYKDAFGITPEGNFEEKNIPNRVGNRLADVAKANEMSLEALDKKLESAREKLLEAREQRTYPHVDDKILTSWNGMMIAALAKAGNVFDNATYTEMAERAVRFIEDNLYDEGRLMARFRDGETKYKGYVDDYANVLWAYIELYHSTLNTDYLRSGKAVSEEMVRLFWDESDGGFYMNGNDSEMLISREKEIYDAAVPSGNGVAAVMLTRLGYLTGETDYLDRVDTMFYTFYNAIERQASASAFFDISLLQMDHRTKEVVVLLSDEDNKTRAHFLDTLRKPFLPDVSLLVGQAPEEFVDIAPFAADYKRIQADTTVYVCENFACQAPTTDLQQAERQIMGMENG